MWWHSAQAFFQRNSGTIDSDRLAACLAAVLEKGPNKTRRIPLIAGPTNAAKSTVLDPIDEVFGEDNVQHTFTLGATMPLANLALKKKRFMYLDEFNMVEFASCPPKRPTIPKTMQMKLFAGQKLEVQVSQSFQNGNADVRWNQGVAMTVKSEGLWSPNAVVSSEDVRHLQSRVEQFTATAQIARSALTDMPKCKESFSKWVVAGACAWALDM